MGASLVAVFTSSSRLFAPSLDHQTNDMALHVQQTSETCSSKPRREQFHHTGRIFEAVSFVFSFATLSLAITYTNQLISAPIAITQAEASNDTRYQQIQQQVTDPALWAVAFYGTTPFLTIVLSLIGTALYGLEIAGQRYGVMVSAFLASVWFVTGRLWLSCGLNRPLYADGSEMGVSSQCHQRLLVADGMGFEGISSCLTAAMLMGCGGMVIL